MTLRLLLWAAALLPAHAADYDALAARFRFPPPAQLDAIRSKGPGFARWIDAYTDRRIWADALRLADENTGLVSWKTLDMEVEFALGPGPYMPKTDVRCAASSCLFKMTIRDAEKWSPPDRPHIVGSAASQLIRAYQEVAGGALEPVWLKKGMVLFSGEAGDTLPSDLDRPARLDQLTSVKEVNALWRGILLYRFLRERYGREAVQGFIMKILVQREPYLQAAQEVTGLSADSFLEEELKYAERLIEDAGKSAPPPGPAREEKPRQKSPSLSDMLRTKTAPLFTYLHAALIVLNLILPLWAWRRPGLRLLHLVLMAAALAFAFGLVRWPLGPIEDAAWQRRTPVSALGGRWAVAAWLLLWARLYLKRWGR